MAERGKRGRALECPQVGQKARWSPSRDPQYNASREHGQKDTIVIIEHFAPDAYGLLILEPEIALGSGWLGGDRVVGRAAIRDLRIKAARFNEHERKRLTVHLPSRALTVRLDEIERYYGA
jgi:hypothetical protein